MEVLVETNLTARILSAPVPAGWPALRAAATAALEGQDLPTTRLEDWKYAVPAALRDWNPVLAGPAPGELVEARLASLILPEARGSRLVFVNGVYDPHHSTVTALPPGVRFLPLASATELVPALGTLALPESLDLFGRLNSARFADGALLCVPRGVRVEPVLHVIFLTVQTGETPAVSLPRLFVRLDRGASATLVEEHSGEGRYLTAPVVEVQVAEDAHLRHERIQRDAPEAFHLGALAARLDRSAIYASRTITFGARFSRQSPRVLLAAEGGDLTLDGLALLGDTQIADTHSVIDHAVPHGQSRQLHKTIVDGHSRAIFNGRILVRPHAQATDAQQQSRNLILSEGAQVDTKPQLEISADDVKCAHGAAIGQIDPEELFYLESRGLSPLTARNLLTYGFAADVLARIPVPTLRRLLRQDVMARTRAGELETLA